MHLDFGQTRRLSDALAGQDLAVAGWVDDFPSVANGQVAFTLRTTASSDGVRLPERMRLTWYDPPAEITPALGLRLVVRLKAPRGFANPGGFDYERWLFVEHIGATGYVRSGALATAQAPSLARRWLAVRAELATRIAKLATTPDSRALLIALALGERSGFEPTHWRVLRATGTSHLVAISGLHVGIVAAWLFCVVRAIWLRIPWLGGAYDLEAASVVSLLGAAVYAAVAGFSVPTQRALIMLSVALALVVMRRSAASVEALAIALIVVTLLDPLAVLSGGFWMSFAAVAVLCALLRERRAATSHVAMLGANARAAVRTQWGVTIGLAPVVAVMFGELSLIAPAVNLIAIPIFAMLLVPLILVATLGLAVGLAGAWLVPLASTLADWIYRGLAWLAAAGIEPIAVPALSPVSLMLLLAGVAVALPAHPLPGRYLGWVAIAAALLHLPARPPPGSLQASVLDVGHGLAVVVLTAEHALLYDTGARYRSGFDTGRDIVLPALRRLGVRRLDRIVVSHADNDHAGGLDAIMAAFPQADLLAGQGVAPHRAIPCLASQQWIWDDVQFAVLHPAVDADRDGNDGSCVIRIDAAHGSLLLTGDIELRGERSLLAGGGTLSTNVIVVPHHGSATSSSQAFVDAVGADVAPTLPSCRLASRIAGVSRVPRSKRGGRVRAHVCSRPESTVQ